MYVISDRRSSTMRLGFDPVAGKVVEPPRPRPLDTRTGRASPVLSVLAQGLSLSADDRWVSYIEPHLDADVWMATLEP